MKNEDLRIGILALQGCVEPHIRHLKTANVTAVEVKSTHQLSEIDGLIIPGGESTTFLKLISLFSLKQPLMDAAKRIPFWGICAGAILMAKKVTHPEQESFELIDVEIARNGYGRQLQSFESEINNSQIVFIRAPIVTKILSPQVKIIHSHDGNPVWLKQGLHQMTTFHPELSLKTPSGFHLSFVEQCLQNKKAFSSNKTQSLA